MCGRFAEPSRTCAPCSWSWCTESSSSACLRDIAASACSSSHAIGRSTVGGWPTVATASLRSSYRTLPNERSIACAPRARSARSHAAGRARPSRARPRPPAVQPARQHDLAMAWHGYGMAMSWLGMAWHGSRTCVCAMWAQGRAETRTLRLRSKRSCSVSCRSCCAAAASSLSRLSLRLSSARTARPTNSSALPEVSRRNRRS